MTTREEVFVDVIYREKGQQKVAESFKKLTDGGMRFEKAVTKGNQATASFSENVGGGLKRVETYSVGATGKMKLLSRSIEDVRQKFNFNNLTLLFAGMVVQRVAENIARSTTATFMKISEGAGEAGRNIMQLGAEFTYLKFEVGRAIGEALTPLLPVLIPLIRSLADFAQKNPTAVFTAVFGAITIGLGMMVKAQVGMFMDMLKSMGDLSGKNFSGATGFLDKLTKGAGVGFGIIEAVNAFQSLKAEEYWSALGSALTSTGLFTLASGNKKMANGGTVLAFAGIALQIADDIDGDPAQIGKKLQDHLIEVAVVAGMRWGFRAGVFTLIAGYSFEPIGSLLNKGMDALKGAVNSGGQFVQTAVGGLTPIMPGLGSGISATPTTSAAFGGGQGVYVDESGKIAIQNYNVNVTTVQEAANVQSTTDAVKRQTGSGTTKASLSKAGQSSAAASKLSAYAKGNSANAKALKAMGY